MYNGSGWCVLWNIKFSVQATEKWLPYSCSAQNSIWTCHPAPRSGRKYLHAQAGNGLYLSSAHLHARAGNSHHKQEASIKLHQKTAGAIWSSACTVAAWGAVGCTSHDDAYVKSVILYRCFRCYLARSV